MAASTLPQEMIPAFIHHLHDDKPSLKACSLVCRAWADPPRLHLFATLTLTWPLQLPAFPFVRHLLLPMSLPLWKDAPTWDEVAPLLVGFDRLVSVRIILFLGTLKATSAQTWLELGKNFSRVQAVNMSFEWVPHSDGPSFAQFAHPISVFPCIRTLTLNGPIMLSTPPELTSEVTFRVSAHLDTLYLSVGNVAVVFEWLLLLPDHPPLRHLHLHYFHDSEVASCHKFMRVYANGLESLSLSPLVLASGVATLTHHPIDARHCTRLRSITFTLSSYGVNRWVTQVLSRISSSHMEAVVFKLHRWPERELTLNEILNALEWHAVDVILQHSTFSGLKDVHFRCKLPSSVFGSAPDEPRLSWAYPTVMKRLPQCHARGIFHLDRSER